MKEINNNKHLLATLKRKSNNGEIIWDTQISWTVLDSEELSLILRKFNEAIDKGRIKMDVKVIWYDDKKQRLNSFELGTTRK